MKKFLALIVACLTVASSYAATVFSSDAFLGTEDAPGAAPVLLRGKLKADSWMLDDSKVCAIVKSKATYDVFLAFCQPCINCITCEETLPLNNATLYVVEKDAKAGKVYITAVPLFGLEAAVTTGKTGQSAKKGDVAMTLAGLGSQNMFGDISDVTLLGAWNQKTWFTGNDENSKGAKVSAIMGIIQKLDGCVSSSIENELWACGTVALRRDDSFTKKLMLAMTDDTKGAVSNPFLNCGVPELELNSCYDVLTSNGEDKDENDELDPADTAVMETMVENYILKKLVPKSYKNGYALDGIRNMCGEWMEVSND